MKKLILILITLLVASVGFAQGRNYHYEKFVTADTITADTGYVVVTSADYVWMLYTTWASTATPSVTTSTVTLQTTGNNGTNWVAEPNNTQDTISTATGETLFQGDYSPGGKYRLYFDLASGDTVIVNAWWNLKIKR